MATDVGGFDPITVSLRDYIDGGNASHDRVHVQEEAALKAALEASQRYSTMVVADHFRTHDKEHAAVGLAFENSLRELVEYKSSHSRQHEDAAKAVETALTAVDRLANIHSEAHQREHHSHETVHQREREAAGLARLELDSRLKELDAYRAQLREQASTFMPRNEATALMDRMTVSIDAINKAADNAHSRMDQNAGERMALLQNQIDKLNLANAANTGASNRTTLLIGTGFTIVTILIAIVGIFLGTQGS